MLKFLKKSTFVQLNYFCTASIHILLHETGNLCEECQQNTPVVDIAAQNKSLCEIDCTILFLVFDLFNIFKSMHNQINLIKLQL